MARLTAESKTSIMKPDEWDESSYIKMTGECLTKPLGMDYGIHLDHINQGVVWGDLRGNRDESSGIEVIG